MDGVRCVRILVLATPLGEAYSGLSFMLRPRILIVDDDTNVRSAFHRWFSCRGFDADEAQDGVEAVEKCRRGAYDVITLDLEMPRMTGLQALPLIRSSQPDVPIVVLTGYATETGSVALNDVARVLVKPMSLRELEDVVRQLLPADK